MSVSSRRPFLRQLQVSARLLEVHSVFFSVLFCFVLFFLLLKEAFVKMLAVARTLTAAFLRIKPSGNEGDTPGSTGFPQSHSQLFCSCMTHQMHSKMQMCINIFLLLLNKCVYILLFKYHVLHFLPPYFNKAKLCCVNGSSNNVKNYLVLL